MGTTYFDQKGNASFLFDKVPIHAVKRAFFTDKLGTVHTLMKLVHNAVTYDFSQSAKGGCVAFASDYSTWEFIAPDGRMGVERGIYQGKTFVEGLRQLQTIVSETPVPAWDQFAVWLNTKMEKVNSYSRSVTVYLMTPDQAYSGQCVNKFVLHGSANFADFLEDVIACVTGAYGSQRMNDYLVDNTIQFVLKLTVMSATVMMHFIFRE